MSQDAVADRCDTSQSAIARIENGNENITMDTLERIVSGLGGRFFVAIYPPEIASRSPRPWWELANLEVPFGWHVTGWATWDTPTSKEAVVSFAHPRPQEANTSAGIPWPMIHGTMSMIPRGV